MNKNKKQKTQSVVMRIWERGVPNSPGLWLRLNAGGRAEIKHVFIMDGELVINWGWSGESGLISVNKNEEKLRGWLWVGPIPEAPDVELRFDPSA
jgi:hypothetical protein